MPDQQTKLAISLVTYNAEKYLPFCLKSLADQTCQNFSLLIIDNGSNDNTVKFLQNNYPQIKLVSHPQNIGFAKAHNQGIAWSTSQYIMILNQDVILEPDYLEKTIGYLDDHPEIAALSGKILFWDFENNQKTGIIDSLGIKVYQSHRVVDISQGKMDNGASTEVTEVFGVSGALPVYRRSVLEKVKIDFKSSLRHQEYFDEDFFSYKEDVDLAYRLRLAGFTAVYFPLAVAYHDRSVKKDLNLSSKAIRQSRRERDRSVKLYSYKNHLLVLLKNEFFNNFFRFFPKIFGYELKKLAFIILYERTSLKGLKIFWQQKGSAWKKRKYIIKNIRKITAKELAKWYK